MATATGIVEEKAGSEVRFLGTFTNKIDAKGRLSVPADFRKMMEAADAGFNGILCTRSFTRPILECGGAQLFDHYLRQVASLDVYDEDRELLEEGFYAASLRLPFDETGRIVLPADFREHAGLEGQATLVGRGGIFQVWNPEAWAERMARLPGIVAQHGETMRARSLPSLSSDRSGTRGGRHE